MDLFASVKESLANQSVAIVDVTNGKEMGWTINLRPMSSPEVQKVERHYKSEIMAASRKGKNLADVIEAQNQAILIAAIDGWEWADNPTFKDKPIDPIEFNPTNVSKVVKDRTLSWVAEQLNRALADDAAFLGV